MATRTLPQRPCSLRSGARKLMAVCVGGALLAGGISAAGQHLNALSGPTTVPGEGVWQSNTAECSISSEKNGTPEPASLMLSKEKLTATLKCSGTDNQVVPQTQTSVCVLKPENTVTTCGTADNQITLRSLLGASEEITWKKIPATKDAQAERQEWSLELKETQLPLSDKEFFVGCQNKKKTGDDVSCKLTVKVDAPPSTVKENVVSCAYGHSSNSDILKVEMSETNNTLTLACGKEGSVTPEKFASNYCVDADNLDKCSKSYKEILPMYQEKWWTTENKENHSVKLAIPTTDFPSTDQRFYIGCLPASRNVETPDNEASGRQAEEQTTAAGTPCKVEVTVKAASAASVADGVTVSPAVGATALIGLVFFS
ncbi:SAG-related sequence [Besnoitia besnoiti]|uniref:SAG-related sequence n=1 Tax=Besnoitia besnoiti TaxID=94643 RepID=A0A2A9MP29_BESBE|nr:SAG-related sequence [Besnoitia besnoiti]PFH37763.1 SAG-related sequence [Besnoitia besnoiti]